MLQTLETILVTTVVRGSVILRQETALSRRMGLVINRSIDTDKLPPPPETWLMIETDQEYVRDVYKSPPAKHFGQNQLGATIRAPRSPYLEWLKDN